MKNTVKSNGLSASPAGETNADRDTDTVPLPARRHTGAGKQELTEKAYFTSIDKAAKGEKYERV